jgi:hypothetical protein
VLGRGLFFQPGGWLENMGLPFLQFTIDEYTVLCATLRSLLHACMRG